MFNLPKSNELAGIMVVLNKRPERTHFIPGISRNDASDIAEIFSREIFKHDQLERKIISDRDSIFT